MFLFCASQQNLHKANANEHQKGDETTKTDENDVRSEEYEDKTDLEIAEDDERKDHDGVPTPGSSGQLLAAKVSCG